MIRVVLADASSLGFLLGEDKVTEKIEGFAYLGELLEGTTNPFLAIERAGAYLALSDLYTRIYGEKIPEIRRDSMNRPYPVREKCDFNLSHSDMLVAVAITDDGARVGIDVEKELSPERAANIEAGYTSRISFMGLGRDLGDYEIYFAKFTDEGELGNLTLLASSKMSCSTVSNTGIAAEKLEDVSDTSPNSALLNFEASSNSARNTDSDTKFNSAVNADGDTKFNFSANTDSGTRFNFAVNSENISCGTSADTRKSSENVNCRVDLATSQNGINSICGIDENPGENVGLACHSFDVKTSENVGVACYSSNVKTSENANNSLHFEDIAPENSTISKWSVAEACLKAKGHGFSDFFSNGARIDEKYNARAFRLNITRGAKNSTFYLSLAIFPNE